MYSYGHVVRVTYVDWMADDQSAVDVYGSREQRYSCHCEALRAHLEVRSSASGNVNE